MRKIMTRGPRMKHLAVGQQTQGTERRMGHCQFSWRDMKDEISKLKLYPSVEKQLARIGRRGQVLELMWAGKATKEIAAELGLSPKTVEYHRAQLYLLFGV